MNVDTVVKWRSGYCPFSHADAQKVAEEISEIGEEARPEQIVDRAKSEDTELHKCFEWDDTEAARKFRLHQARQIVGCLVFTVVEKPIEHQEIRFFQKPKVESGYKQTQKIMCNPDEYHSLILRMKADFQSFKNKYVVLQELKALWDTFDSLKI